MKEEIDTSFSGITSKIQGDKDKAKELAVELIKKFLETIKIESDLEKELENVSFEKGSIKRGLDHIAKHMKMNMPFSIVTDQAIYEVHKDGIFEEVNFLK